MDELMLLLHVKTIVYYEHNKDYKSDGFVVTLWISTLLSLSWGLCSWDEPGSEGPAGFGFHELTF